METSYGSEWEKIALVANRTGRGGERDWKEGDRSRFAVREDVLNGGQRSDDNRGERRRVFRPPARPSVRPSMRSSVLRRTPPGPDGPHKLIGMLGRDATSEAVCSDVMLAV